MSIAIHFAPPAMTAAQYDEVTSRLADAGLGHPVGRESHVCFGEASKLQVLDVWTSMEAFQRFGETLFPIIASLGIDPGQPSILPAHNVITPAVNVITPATTAV